MSGIGSRLGGIATVDSTIDVNPGPVRGAARCTNVGGLGVTLGACAWVGNGAMVSFAFSGLSPQESAQQVPVILAAVVAKK